MSTLNSSRSKSPFPAFLSFASLALWAGCGSALAQVPLLTIPQHVWDTLQADERAALSSRYSVNLMPDGAYGTILDAQTLNESTPGSNAMSYLGSRYGGAAYVDHAFRGNNWNYSATNNLNAQLAGAMIGSLFDKPPQARFRSRYTIKTGDGAVHYVEEVRGDAFRHPVGLCVALGPIRPIGDFCGMTREQVLAKYAVKATQNMGAQPTPATPVPQTTTRDAPQRAAASTGYDSEHAKDIVHCKFGDAAGVPEGRWACETSGGIVVP